MLKELEVRNIQAHRHLKIEFDPCVTTIVGKNDVGKTAVIRALEWLCLNTPSADLLRDGASVMKVKLAVDNHTIVRKKGNGNLYRLDDKKYRAFATNVPEDIAKTINVGELNFQNQFDPHFWLFLPPSQVSKELNAIINLEAIDNSLAKAAAEVRQAKAAVEFTSQRVKEARQQKKDLAWVREADQDLRRIEDIDGKLSGVVERRGVLETLIDKVSKYQTIQKRTEELGRQGQEIVSKLSRVESLRSIVGRLREVSKITEPIPSLKDLKRLIGRRERLTELIESIKYQTTLAEQRCPVCLRKL
jgi:chromosome segregation ATPase